MMEFTWNGIVRQGFGFDNPNHAAALLCALLPFFWGWQKRAWLGWSIAAGLTAMLAATFSRTGAIVLLLEFSFFLWQTAPSRRKPLWYGFSLLALILVAGGIGGRFGMDRAITNRPLIWRAGLDLYAANPLGVGLGNSGNIASAFLLEGIRCRTLVHCHLTLLAECGFFVGAAWFTVIIRALAAGWRKRAGWCAFAGLTLSGCASTVFDWSKIFGTGLGTRSDMGMAYWGLAVYWGLAIYLIWPIGRGRQWVPAIAGGMALALAPLLVWPVEPQTPKVRDGVIRQGNTEPMPLILYTEEWTLAAIRPYLPANYELSVAAGNSKRRADAVWLFGNAAEFAYLHPHAQIHYVEPPEHIRTEH